MGEKSDDHEIVGGLLVQNIGNVDLGTLVLGVHNAVITLDLLQSPGSRARNGGYIVPAIASQLKGEGAADAADTENSDTQRWGRGHAGVLAHCEIYYRTIVSLTIYAMKFTFRGFNWIVLCWN